MLEVSTHIPRRFYYRPPTQDLGITDLVLRVYDNNGVEIAGSPFAASVMSAPLGIYQTDKIAFSAPGAYYYVWESVLSSLKESGSFSVLDNPTGSFPTQQSRKYRYEAPAFQSGVTDIVLNIYDQDGNTVGSSPYSTTETATSGLYETDSNIAISAEGAYLFAWTSDSGGYSFTQIEVWLLLDDASLRQVLVTLADNTANPQVAVANADVLVSKTDGTPVVQSRTDMDGHVYFTLSDGDYVLSFRKSGYTFSRNNVRVTVSEPTDPDTNDFMVLTSPFAATFDQDPPLGASDLSKAKIRLADLNGNPIAGCKILITNEYVPTVKTNASGSKVLVAGLPLAVETDGNGYAEVELVRGTSVVVAIEDTSIRRTITVPDQNEFELLDLITSADDPFDVLNIKIPTMVRR